MKIKVVFNEETRRWRSSKDVSFDSLVAYVKQSWGETIPEHMGLTFRDDEGDSITITNDVDLEEALTIANEDNRHSLKISVIDLMQAPDEGFVVLGDGHSDLSSCESDTFDAEIEEAEEPTKTEEPKVELEMEIQQIPEPETAEPVSEVVASVEKAEAEPETPSAEPTPVNAPEMKADESVPPCEDEQPTDKIDWKQMAEKFFANEEITTALEAGIDILFNSIREGEQLSVALDVMLASLPVLHEHPLVQAGLPFLPAFLPRLAPAVPFLLLLGPDAAKRSLSKLKTLIQTCCNAPENAEIDITPILGGCCPEMIKLMESGLKNGQEQTVDVGSLLGQFGLGMPDLEARAAAENQRRQEEQRKQKEAAERLRAGKVVHEGVTCDGCGKSPIVGARFKSAVLPDFDLCEECEDKGVDEHPKEYPMIKMNQAMKNIQESDMKMHGLREFLWQFRRARGRGGRRGRGRGRGCPWKKWANGGKCGKKWGDSEWAAERMQSWQNRCGQGQEDAADQDHEHHHEHHGHHHHSHRRHSGGRWGGRGRGRRHRDGPPAWAQVPESQQGPEVNANKFKAKAVFVEDVTIPDRSQFGPGMHLIKTWRMRNTGKSAWEGVSLQFVKGEKGLLGQNSAGSYPVGKVLAGQTVDINAHIVTPQEPGRFASYFRLQTANGNRFGPKIWVDIVVLSAEEYNQQGSDQGQADLQKAIDASLKQQQTKRIKKLGGLERKLARKLERLEKRNNKISNKLDKQSKKTQASKPEKYNKYVNKLEEKLAKVDDQTKRTTQKLEEVSTEKSSRLSMVNTLNQAPEPVKAPMCSIVAPDATEQKEEVIMPTEQPEPAAEPAFQYQAELAQVQAMGFNNDVKIVKYLLVENKGDTTKVVNHLLTSLS